MNDRSHMYKCIVSPDSALYNSECKKTFLWSEEEIKAERRVKRAENLRERERESFAKGKLKC